MEIKRAGEIMVPLDHYPHIPYWFTVRQAIAEMETAEIDARGRKSIPRVILVFDQTYRLMGFIRRRDILRGLLPNFVEEEHVPHADHYFDVNLDPNLDDLFSEQELEKVRDHAEKPVSEIMNPIVNTVDYDASLLKVIRDIVVNNHYMLPVMRDGKVAGVVRSLDVLHEIAKLVL